MSKGTYELSCVTDVGHNGWGHSVNASQLNGSGRWFLCRIFHNNKATIRYCTSRPKIEKMRDLIAKLDIRCKNWAIQDLHLISPNAIKYLALPPRSPPGALDCPAAVGRFGRWTVAPALSPDSSRVLHEIRHSTSVGWSHLLPSKIIVRNISVWFLQNGRFRSASNASRSLLIRIRFIFRVFALKRQMSFE